MREMLKKLFCRHRYYYRTSYPTLNGTRLYIYVCPICGKVKQAKKPMEL